jgi:hypothetical protein
MRRFIVYLVIALVFWAGVYVVYFLSFQPNKDEEVAKYAGEFRKACFALGGGWKCLSSPEFGWKESWPVPDFIWKYEVLTPWYAVTPFYFVPGAKQFVLIDPYNWATLPAERRRELVWHEMGHSNMGWHHSDKECSLLYPAFSCWHKSSLFKLRTAIQENEK